MVGCRLFQIPGFNVARFDVFNGDADGICALHQLRLFAPADDAELVTGPKRDIALLQRVSAGAGDDVTVLDISMEKNQDDLRRILDAGAKVTYFDHHRPGEIPEHEQLTAHIDTASNVCTSLLVNRYLNGRYKGWAVVAAFGDNIIDSAEREAEGMGLSDSAIESLKELGICLNYNGYGSDLADLYFHPADLYRALRPYEDPFAFINEEGAFQTLRNGYYEDMAKAEAIEPETADEHTALFEFPDSDWARRVSGVFGNELAQRYPRRAHAILTRVEQGYRVSVRAPLSLRQGADDLCGQFPTGGGRKGAAGINLLPEDQLPRFMEQFAKQFANS